MLAVILVNLVGCQNNENKRRGAPPTIKIVAERASINKFKEKNYFTGKIEAENRSTIKPETSGRVTKILVEEGDQVVKGQLMMVLNHEELSAKVKESEAKLKEVIDRYTRRVKTPDSFENYSRELLERLYQEIEQRKQQLKAIKSKLENKYIKAPVRGTVGEIKPDIGDYVEENQEITIISDNSELKLNISVPTTTAQRIKVGQLVEVTDKNEEIVDGKVVFIAPNVDEHEQMIVVKAIMNDTENSLRNGEIVESTITFKEKEQLSIPAQAVVTIGNKAFVYKLIRENKSTSSKQERKTQQINLQDYNFEVKQVLVRLGKLRNGKYPVEEGLEIGDLVAISKTSFLRNGAQIKIAEVN